MFRADAAFPASMPVLSRGKHRNARKGACFMEFASYLAGERWSDHPKCTHPLLAEVARLVNDHTSDENRTELVELVPSVIGLTSDDLVVDVLIALRCARAALPVVSAERQNIMAVSILTADRVLSGLDPGRGRASEEESRSVLEQAPRAAQWAYRFAGTRGPSPQQFRRHAAPNTVRCAVRGIAEACTPHPDRMLRDLLAGAIADCEAARDRETAQASLARREPSMRWSAR